MKPHETKKTAGAATPTVSMKSSTKEIPMNMMQSGIDGKAENETVSDHIFDLPSSRRLAVADILGDVRCALEVVLMAVTGSELLPKREASAIAWAIRVGDDDLERSVEILMGRGAA